MPDRNEIVPMVEKTLPLIMIRGVSNKSQKKKDGRAQADGNPEECKSPCIIQDKDNVKTLF